MNYKFKLCFFWVFVLNIFFEFNESICEAESKSIIPYIEALNVVNAHSDFQSDSIYRTSQIIIKSIKKKGILVDGFIVDRLHLIKIPLPFMAYLQDRGWCIVNNLNSSLNTINITDPNGVQEVLKQSEFLSLWQGQVVSEVITNVPVYKIPINTESLKFDNKIVIVYLNHDRFRNFNNLKPFLDSFIKDFKDDNPYRRNVIYIDELGLIPEDAVNSRSSSTGISREDAFEQLKSMFQKELWRIKDGYSLYDPVDFYKRLYKYMADKNIDCYIEDLDYRLWELIVSFDDLAVFKLARYYFISGDFTRALHTLRTYQDGYSMYNIKIRDENFVSQIEKLKKEHPNSIIFTARGLAHYGMENIFVNKGDNVQVLFVGNENFLENFSFQQTVFLLKRNKVFIDEAEENILLMRTFPQETLRVYFDEYNKDINLITKITLDIARILNVSDLQDLSEAWRNYFANKGYKNRDYNLFSEFTFNWLKDQGFIKEEYLKFFQN